jgi:hypothetical protein
MNGAADQWRVVQCSAAQWSVMKCTVHLNAVYGRGKIGYDSLEEHYEGIMVPTRLSTTHDYAILLHAIPVIMASIDLANFDCLPCWT